MSAHALRSSSALQRMKSTMSGWSALSTTILAARRVLPPDLITPAEASAARMKDTGPEAVPLPDAALAPRRAERAAQVLRDDDVGRELRPGLRHLDVALLEDGLAALAGDDRRADLPLDRVVGVGPRRHEAPRDRQAARRRGLRRAGRGPFLPSHQLRRHAQPPPGTALYLAVAGLIHHHILCCQGFFSSVATPAAR